MSSGYMITLNYPLPQSTQSLLLQRPRGLLSAHWPIDQAVGMLLRVLSEHAEVNRTQQDTKITIIYTSSQMTQGMLPDSWCWIFLDDILQNHERHFYSNNKLSWQIKSNDITPFICIRILAVSLCFICIVNMCILCRSFDPWVYYHHHHYNYL